MDELQIGERIAALDSRGDIVYSEVISFLDRQPSEKRQFIRISTESGKTLTLTPAHLVPVEGKSITFAARVEVGDRILIRDSAMEISENKVKDRLGYDRVVDAKLVLEEGVFAPLTSEGTLIVNDVVASCYAIIDSQTIAHYSFLPYRLWKSLTSGVSRFSKFLEESLTKESEIRSKPPEQDSNSWQESEGVLWYASMLYSLSSYVIPANMLY